MEFVKQLALRLNKSNSKKRSLEKKERKKRHRKKTLKKAAKPKPEKRENLEKKVLDPRKRFLKSLIDLSYRLLNESEAVLIGHYGNRSYAFPSSSINIYDAYTISDPHGCGDNLYEPETSIKEETLRDLVEDSRLRDEGQTNGSGKYIRPEAKQRLEDYKLLFENFIWIRVKYSLSFG